jgi:hypothetical protein
MQEVVSYQCTYVTIQFPTITISISFLFALSNFGHVLPVVYSTSKHVRQKDEK